jgi:hypothetical protein
LDRLIAEHEANGRSARCHLLSVVGNDQEIAAIAAAISDEARFYAMGPDFSRIMISLGKEAQVFRVTINIPGRRRPLRHLVAVPVIWRRVLFFNRSRLPRCQAAEPPLIEADHQAAVR